jgi:hypothetical protein
MTTSDEKIILVNKMQQEIDHDVDIFFEKIKKYIISYAFGGYTSMTLFLPTNKNLKTKCKYHIIIYDIGYYLADECFSKKIVKKFKTEGIKLKINKAWYSIKCHKSYNTCYYNGYILNIYWNKNYSKTRNSCTII